MIEAPPSTVEKDLDFGIQDTAFLVLQQEMKGRGRDERRRQNEQKEERERAKAGNSKWGNFVYPQIRIHPFSQLIHRLLLLFSKGSF